MKLETCIYKKGNKWLEGFVAYDMEGKEIIIDKKNGVLIGEMGHLFEGHLVTFKDNRLEKIEEI